MARIRSYRAEAVVLKRHDVSEADRVLVLFTRQRGKLRAVAKGIRKTTSRKAGHLELFTHADLQIEARRDLDLISQAETIESFRGLREELSRTTHAFLVAELADELTADHVEQGDLFELLVDTFRALASDAEPALVVQHYQVQLLSLAGYRPSLDTCLTCGSALEPGANFLSPFLGGALCPRCGPIEVSARPLSTDALRLMRNMQRSGPPGSIRVRVPTGVSREVERALRDMVERHTERRVRSSELIARIDAELGQR